MVDKKKMVILSLLLIGVFMIVVGGTYSFFRYKDLGKKTVSTQLPTVKLHYDEGNMQGISISDTLPMNDETGKKQNYFEFTITGETTSIPIKYNITARKNGNSEDRIPVENIRIQLTNVNGTGANATEPDVLLLEDYKNLTNVIANGHEEQLLYTKVITNNHYYEERFRVRIWLKEDTDFTPIDTGEDYIYPLEGKEFSITVNVYSTVYDAPTTCDYAFDLVGEGKEYLAVGDEIKMGNEHFVVIDTNSTTTTAIAKYNVTLLGFATPTGSVEGKQYDGSFPCTSGSGTCYNGSFGKFAQNIPFSKTNYWALSSNLDNVYNKYRRSAPSLISTACNKCSNSLDDERCNPNCYIRREYNSSDGYSIAYYVEDYRERLEAEGATIYDSRLLTLNEANYLINNTDVFNKISKRGFWLGTAYDEDEIYAYVEHLVPVEGANYSDLVSGPTPVKYNFDNKGMGSATYEIDGEIITPTQSSIITDENENTYWKEGVRPVLEIPTCSIDLTGE